MNTPLVSILIPAYNAEKYITIAIDSVLNQSYPAIEIIVVNDGSKDDTASILAKYGDKITVVHQSNMGQCAANNKAFNVSKGDYVKFFDADDVLSRNHIELQVNRLAKYPNCVASSECWRFYNDDLSNPLFEPLANWKDLPPLEWLKVDNGKGFGMMQCGMFLIPRKLLEKSGLWDEELSLINDFEFFPRVLLKADKILFCASAKLFYRSGLSQSLSAQKSSIHLESAFKALTKTTTFLLEHDNSFEMKKNLASFWRKWSYEFYPLNMEYYKISEKKILELGGSIHFYRTGVSGFLSFLIGWKTVKLLKLFVSKRIAKFK